MCLLINIHVNECYFNSNQVSADGLTIRIVGSYPYNRIRFCDIIKNIFEQNWKYAGFFIFPVRTYHRRHEYLIMLTKYRHFIERSVERSCILEPRHIFSFIAALSDTLAAFIMFKQTLKKSWLDCFKCKRDIIPLIKMLSHLQNNMGTMLQT